MRRAILGLCVLGCSPATDSSAGDTTSGTTTTFDPGPMTTVDPTATTIATAVDTGSAQESSGGSFIVSPDGGTSYDCNLWKQDCPAGEKCVPWGDGEGGWNATRCTPVASDPNDVGEPCTVVGSTVSGIDDCAFGAMCWNVDPETNAGECVAMCQGGSENDAFCEDPCDRCPIGATGLLILCQPPCDPIGQDCGEGWACHPVGDTFACEPDASGEDGVAGDPCDFVDMCDAGNFCAAADTVPDCAGADGCCAPFCAVGDADGCAALPGTSCVPWFVEGEGPEGCVSGDVGACAVVP